MAIENKTILLGSAFVPKSPKDTLAAKPFLAPKTHEQNPILMSRNQNKTNDQAHLSEAVSLPQKQLAQNTKLISETERLLARYKAGESLTVQEVKALNQQLETANKNSEQIIAANSAAPTNNTVNRQSIAQARAITDKYFKDPKSVSPEEFKWAAQVQTQDSGASIPPPPKSASATQVGQGINTAAQEVFRDSPKIPAPRQDANNGNPPTQNGGFLDTLAKPMATYWAQP